MDGAQPVGDDGDPRGSRVSSLDLLADSVVTVDEIVSLRIGIFVRAWRGVLAFAGSLILSTLLVGCVGASRSASTASGAAVPAPVAATTSTINHVGGDDFCRQVTDAIKSESSVASSGGSTPDVIRQQYEAGKSTGQAALLVAPADIKPDLQLLVDASNQLGGALAKVNYDVTKLPASATATFSTPKVQAASTHVLVYVQQHCGVSSGGATPSTSGP